MTVHRRTFVYRPGAPAHRDVYGNWIEMQAAIRASDGPRSIEIDNTIVAVPSIPPNPTGDPWDFYGMELGCALGTNNVPVVTIEDGAKFSRLSKISNLDLESHSSEPVISVASESDGFTLLSGSSLASAGGFAPFIRVEDDQQLVIGFDLGAALKNAGAIAVEMGERSMGIIAPLSSSTIAEDCISGPVSSVAVLWMIGVSVALEGAQPQMLGAMGMSYMTDALYLGTSDVDGSKFDGTPPENQSEWNARVAAALAGLLPGGTIP